MIDKSRPDVSVCMITFNHEHFIKAALDSVLSQVFDGVIEVVICDDSSTDRTPLIIKEYISSCPEVNWNIKFNTSNIGIAANFAQAILMCKGRYVAVLEGDDYWTDKHKLRKQVSILDSDSELSVCYTNCIERDEINDSTKVTGPEHPEQVDIEYILKNGWFIRTPTLMFRRDLVKDFPTWFFKTYSTDYVLQVLLAAKGLVYRLDEVTAVYRRHPSGISSSTVEVMINRYSDKIALLDVINAHLDGQYCKAIRFQQRENYKGLVNYSIRSGIWSNSVLRHSTFYRQKGVINMAWKSIVNRMIP